jgi:Carboxypeptidase regulatory-like domain/Tetratricopeptide repeat
VLRPRLVLRSFVALLLLPAAGLLRSLASPLANLTGIVYSESSNQRIPHASVWLCDKGRNRMQESISTDSGEFAFLGVRQGDYILSVSAAGYQPVDLNIEVSFGTEHGLSVFLKSSGSSAPDSPGGSSVSAHELSMPKAARDLFDSGKAKLYADKNPRKALNDFESAVAKAPGYYEAYYQMGMTYLSLRDLAQAEKNLQKSIDLSNQSYGDAVLALAILWLGQRDTARGEPLLRQGLELNQNYWLGFFELGKLEMYRGNFPPALHAAEKAQFLAPAEPLVYRLLSLIHLKQQNYSAALADLDAYIRLDPDSPEGLRAKEIRADTQKRLANPQSSTSPQEANVTPALP